MIDNFSLPVSEELLGAYLEGNLSDEELTDVQHTINSDNDLSSLINEILQNDIDWSISIKDDYASDQLDFELPIVHNEIDTEVSQLISIDYPCDEIDVEEISSDIHNAANIHDNLYEPSEENGNLVDGNDQYTNHINFDPTDDEMPLDLDNL